MRFLFGSKRGSSSFAALNENEDQGGESSVDSPSHLKEDNHVKQASKNNRDGPKNNKRITTNDTFAHQKDPIYQGWPMDLDSTNDLNVTFSSQRTIDSFHTAKTSSNKKQFGYTQTVNKPLKSNSQTHFSHKSSYTEADSVMSGVTADTNHTTAANIKKKKRFQELFRAFQKGNKRNQRAEDDDIRNISTSFAAAVTSRSDIPEFLQQTKEASKDQSKNDETVEYYGTTDPTDQFGLNVSSLDETGFESLDAPKEWNTTGIAADLDSFDREDVSEMLASEFSSHDNNYMDWKDSQTNNIWDSEKASVDMTKKKLDAITSTHYMSPSHDNLVKHTHVDVDTSLPWRPAANIGIAPVSPKTVGFNMSEDTKYDGYMAPSHQGLLPQLTDDIDSKISHSKSPSHFHSTGNANINKSSSYETHSEDDSDSSSEELDFSNDSRFQNSSTSSRITLGIMAQISGSVDYSTFTSHTGESTQYGTAYTYEQDDTLDSQDDDEIAQALLLSVDAKDLAVVPNIDVSNSLMPQSARMDNDSAPFRSNMSGIDVFGFDTSADISSLFDSDQSLFIQNVSGASNQSSSLMEEAPQQQTPIKSLPRASENDAFKRKSSDYGPFNQTVEKKQFTPSRTQTQVDLWMQKVQKSKETMHPPTDWPETPIKQVPDTPTTISIDPHNNASFIENDLSIEISSNDSPSATKSRSTPSSVKGLTRDLLHHSTMTSTSSTTRPFFWRSHPSRSGTDSTATHPYSHNTASQPKDVQKKNKTVVTNSWIKSSSTVNHETLKSATNHNVRQGSWTSKTGDSPIATSKREANEDDTEPKSTSIALKKAFFESKLSMTEPKIIASGSFQSSKKTWNNPPSSLSEKSKIQSNATTTANSTMKYRGIGNSSSSSPLPSYIRKGSPVNVSTPLERLKSPSSVNKPPFLVASTPGSTTSSVRGNFPIRSSGMEAHHDKYSSSITSPSMHTSTTKSSPLPWSKKSISSTNSKSSNVVDKGRDHESPSPNNNSSSIADKIRMFEGQNPERNHHHRSNRASVSSKTSFSPSPTRSYKSTTIRDDDFSQSPVRFNASTLSKWKTMSQNLGGLWQ